MRPDEFPSGKTVEPYASAAWALLPPSIVSFGNEQQPACRLLTLQSTIARAVHLAALAGRVRRSPQPSGLPAVRLR